MAQTAVELAEAYAIAVQREISRSLFGTARRPRRR